MQWLFRRQGDVGTYHAGAVKMPVYTVKFGQHGRGQQLSNAPKGQRGLLSAQNVTNTDGAVSKRPGADIVPLSRSDDPADLIPDARAIASRGNDVVVVTDTELYSYQTCGLGGAGTAGTATPAEISDALDAVEVRAAPTQIIDVPLPGSATAASTRTRLDRADVPTTPVVITPSGRSVSVALSESGGVITWTATEGTATDSGQLTGSVQRLARIEEVTGIPAFGGFETVGIGITWISQDGSVPTLETVTLKLFDAIPPGPTPPSFEPVFETLSIIRGTAAGSSYELSGGAIAGFEVSGTLRVWQLESLGTSQGYTVANPPDDSVPYAIDVAASSFPVLTTGLAVAWGSSADGIAHAAQLKTDDSTVISQMSYSGILTGSAIQIAIFDAAVVTWDIADSTGAQASGTRMVWRFNPLDTAIRAIDLPAGADMRMKFTDTPTGGAQYDIADATTTNQLYPVRPVQGISSVIDDQWAQHQTDTIYGVLTSDTGGLFEVLWERTAEVAAVLVDAAVFSAALAVSTNRLTATWWQADTDLRIRYRTLITTTPIDAAFAIASGVGVVGGVISAAVEFEDAGGTAVMGSATWRDDGQVLSLYVREFDGSIFMERVDGFPEIPEYAAEVRGSLGIGPFRIIFSVQYVSGSREVYEATPTLFVRVSPALEVRAGGNFAPRGAWTRTRVLSDVVRHHGNEDVLSADAATVLNDTGQSCTFVASEVTGVVNGALFDILSTHTEAQGTLDATGRRPRVSPFDDRRLAVSYESAALELVTGTWSPGSAISFTATGHTLLAERAWDQASFATNGESAVVLAAADDFGAADAIAFHIYPDISPVLNLSTATGVTTIVDVGVSARALPDGVSVQLAWGVVGYTAPGTNNQLVAGVIEVNLDTLAVNFLFSRSVPYPGGTAVEPVAVSVDSRDGTTVEAWVELEGPINRHVEVVDVDASKHGLLTSWKRCALVSQLAEVVGQVVGAISLLGTSLADTDVTDDTFVGGQVYRDGIMLICARTEEVVGRVAVGSVEDFATRQLRPPKTGLNIGPDARLDLGWQETDLDISSTRAPTLVRYAWTPDSDAYEPAVLDQIIVGANGGYPRMYDGRTTHEHDWHHLSEIVNIATPADGTLLAAGNYNVAVTFEFFDSTGKRYRSRPTFAGPITLLSGDKIDVLARGLSLTEREGVQMVFWRTTEQTAGNADPTYYREIDIPAILPGAVNAIQASLSLADTLLVAREPLDQGDIPGDVLPSDPIEITDFTATLDGRIWGVAPRQPSSAYYTVAKGEASGVAKGAHWSLAQIVTHDGPGRLTAAVQMGSRIGILTALDGSGLYTPGPDATGAGSYQTPEPLNMSIGPRSQASVAKIPEGIVFAPARLAPVQLLSNGWVAVDLGDEIADPFETGVEIPVSLAYIQSTNALHVLGSEPGTTHQLQFDSKTWETDTRRGGLDLTVRDNGQLVILSPSLGVLFEDEAQFSSGGTGYVTSVRTAWLLTDGRPEVAGNLLEVRVHGLYRGEHALTMRIREDYSESVVAEIQVSQQTIADHAASGTPYIYYYRDGRSSTAISVEVLDDGPPNQSFAIEMIIVSTEPAAAGSGSLALRTRNLPKQHAFVTPQ